MFCGSYVTGLGDILFKLASVIEHFISTNPTNEGCACGDSVGSEDEVGDSDKLTVLRTPYTAMFVLPSNLSREMVKESLSYRIAVLVPGSRVALFK
jgi:hypothetical protein